MRLFLPVSLILLSACGCAAKAPVSFSPVAAPGWTTIEIRDGVEYDRAWSTVLNILVKDFDLEFVLKDDGYIRTAWMYAWAGKYQNDYRVRVTAKFADNRKSLNVKLEAQALQQNTWQIGVDSRLISALKTDLMGTIGRTTR